MICNPNFLSLLNSEIPTINCHPPSFLRLLSITHLAKSCNPPADLTEVLMSYSPPPRACRAVSSWRDLRCCRRCHGGDPTSSKLLTFWIVLRSFPREFQGFLGASMGFTGVQTMVVVVNPMPKTPNDGCFIGLSILSWLMGMHFHRPYELSKMFQKGWYGLAESDRRIFQAQKIYAVPVWKWCLVGCHPILLKSNIFLRPIAKMSTSSSPKSGFGVSDCSQEPKVSLEKRLSSWSSRSPKIYSQVKHGESGFFYFLSQRLLQLNWTTTCPSKVTFPLPNGEISQTLQVNRTQNQHPWQDCFLIVEEYIIWWYINGVWCFNTKKINVL